MVESSELEATPKTFSRFGFWYSIVTVIISLIIPTIPAIILIALQGPSALTSELIVLFSLLVYITWVASGLLAWKINKVAFKEVFNFKQITIGKVILSFVIAVIAQFATIAIGYALGNIIGQEIEGNASDVINTSMPPSVLALSVVLALIFAPICEEILFRGLILDGFINTSRKLRMKEPVAITISIILSSILFGLAHLNSLTVSGTMTFAVTGLFGAWLAVIRLKTNSLSLNILTHMFFNFSAVILIFLFQ